MATNTSAFPGSRNNAFQGSGNNARGGETFFALYLYGSTADYRNLTGGPDFSTLTPTSNTSLSSGGLISASSWLWDAAGNYQPLSISTAGGGGGTFYTLGSEGVTITNIYGSKSNTGVTTITNPTFNQTSNVAPQIGINFSFVGPVTVNSGYSDFAWPTNALVGPMDIALHTAISIAQVSCPAGSYDFEVFFGDLFELVPPGSFIGVEGPDDSGYFYDVASYIQARIVPIAGGAEAVVPLTGSGLADDVLKPSYGVYSGSFNSEALLGTAQPFYIIMEFSVLGPAVPNPPSPVPPGVIDICGASNMAAGICCFFVQRTGP